MRRRSVPRGPLAAQAVPVQDADRDAGADAQDDRVARTLRLAYAGRDGDGDRASRRRRRWRFGLASRGGLAPDPFATPVAITHTFADGGTFTHDHPGGAGCPWCADRRPDAYSNAGVSTAERRLVSGILEAPTSSVLRWWLSGCANLDIDVEQLRRDALEATRPHEERRGRVYELERRWYASLDAGAPDWTVYQDRAYLADLWACWVGYSRKYLVQLRKSYAPGGVLEELRDVRRVADLGCGCGLSTTALAELFPEAEVVGTNLAGTEQYEIARINGEARGFEVVSELEEVGHVDLVFASEYFEHFGEPGAHLEDVLDLLRPAALLVASTFGAPSIGHFRSYEVDGRVVPGGSTGRAFNAILRRRGYEAVTTGWWNNRPAYWRRVK